jgi:hypothetical protein
VRLATELIDRRPAWPWQPLPSISEVKVLLERYDSIIAGRTDDYFALLTLLPRVIAAMDLTFPVVVFSSTGQRTVAESLKDHENIITAFEKPRFFGYRSDEVSKNARSGFAAAMEQASAALRARSAVQRICSNIAMPPSGETRDGEYMMELYLDETGSEFEEKSSPDRELTVGGLFVAGEREAVEEFNRVVSSDIADMLDAGGVAYKNYLKTNVDKLAGHIVETAENLGTFVSIVRLTGRATDKTGDAAHLGSVENYLVGDNLGRELVGAVTESAVYHMGSIICQRASRAQYRVHIGTRVLEINTPERTQLAEKLRENWGIPSRLVDTDQYVFNAISEIGKLLDRRPDGDLQRLQGELAAYAARCGFQKKAVIQLVDNSAARPIIQGISRQYQRANFRPLAERARGYGLNQRLKDDTRLLHYAADPLISNEALAVQCPAMMQLRAHGFQGDFNAELRMILQGARQAANGFRAQGLASAARAIDVADADKDDLRRYLLTTLLYSAVEMSGTEFLQLVRALQKKEIKTGASGAHRRIRTATVTKTSKEQCLLTLESSGVEMRFPKKIKYKGSSVELRRGDQLDIEIRSEMTIWGTEDVPEADAVLDLWPHPDWHDLKKGDPVHGAVDGASGKGRFIKLESIDGFVPFNLAPTWSGEGPAFGTHYDFVVEEVDVSRRRLVLRPIL